MHVHSAHPIALTIDLRGRTCVNFKIFNLFLLFFTIPFHVQERVEIL